MLRERAALRVYGSRMSMRRYQSGRLADAFESKAERAKRGNLRRTWAVISKGHLWCESSTFLERVSEAVQMPLEAYKSIALLTPKQLGNLRGDGIESYEQAHRIADLLHARKLALMEELPLSHPHARALPSAHSPP